jgi:transposase-like protein
MWCKLRECPHCHQTEKQIKAGKTKFGSQRFKCKACHRLYAPNAKAQGYPDALRQQAVRLCVDGMNFHCIGRHLGVDHKSVMNWVKAYSARLPSASVPEDVNNAEMDELFTFVGSKKQSLRDDFGG